MRRLALAVFIAFAAQAQVRDQITVEVVDVPVYVINDDGSPVGDLNREDFQLFVNGKPQRIDYFDVIDFATPAPAPSAAAQPAPQRDIRDRRLFLLLFDFSAGNPHLITRAQQGVAAMVRDAPPSDYFAIATYSTLHGVQFIAPFTADRDVTRRAIAALRPSEAHDPLELAISNPERLALDSDVAASPKDAQFAPEIAKIVDTHNAILQMPQYRLAEQQMKDFRELAERLVHLEGYKHLLFLSSGFPVPLGDSQLFRRYDEMRRAFLASNVIVDSIDLTVNDVFSKDLHFGSEGLHGLARDTGGQHIHNENPPPKALARITTSTARGYRLGFNLPANAKRGDNAIEVKIAKLPPGTLVSYRRGFSRDVAKQDASDALLLADIIMNDIPQSGVAPLLRLTAAKDLEVGVPAGGDVDVLLYVFDAKGTIVDYQEKRIKTPGVVRAKLDLPPGQYVAKALVRSGDSIGFSRLSFGR